MKKLPRELLEIDKAIIDTPLPLPYIGLKVRGLSEEVMKKLNEIELYYPYIMITELIGVIMRKARRAGLSSIPKIALRNFNSIIYGEVIRLISPIDQDLEIAHNLITRGLNDLFTLLNIKKNRNKSHNNGQNTNQIPTTTQLRNQQHNPININPYNIKLISPIKMHQQNDKHQIQT